MPFIALPGGIRVVVEWETGGGIAVCIHFAALTGTGPVLTNHLVDATTAFNNWGVAIRNLQHVGCVRKGIEARAVDVENGEDYLVVPSASLAGSDTSGAAPNNVAIVTTHYTAKTGRSFRGRNYLPGIAKDVVAVGDQIASAKSNLLIGAYSALVTELNGYNLRAVVASYNKDKAPRTVGVATSWIGSSVDPVSDSQRRRLFGRGA